MESGPFTDDSVSPPRQLQGEEHRREQRVEKAASITSVTNHHIDRQRKPSGEVVEPRHRRDEYRQQSHGCDATNYEDRTQRGAEPSGRTMSDYDQDGEGY